MFASNYSVALTGGIASGKSTVAAVFASVGAEVVDADDVSRDLVAPGLPALAEVVDAFGMEILDANGRLNRSALRSIVFKDIRARRTLEGIIHPRVQAAIREKVLRGEAPYFVLEVPLLVEAANYFWVNRVVVVDVPRATQLRRLTARKGVDPVLAEQILNAQASRVQRLAVADDVIDNDGSIEHMTSQVLELHHRILADITNT